MAGNSWKWLEWLTITRNCWKCLEPANMAENGWNGSNWRDIAGIARNG